MIRSIFAICTANICRSPIAAAVLAELLPDLKIGSAGVEALVGHEMDKDAREAGRALGLTIPPHRARQLDEALGRTVDLLLVMEQHHRNTIAQHWPHLVSKTFLLGQYHGKVEVPDPYRRGLAAHIQSGELIQRCAMQWAAQLMSRHR